MGKWKWAAAIAAFIFFTAPGAVDSWWSLTDRFRKKETSENVTIDFTNLGQLYDLFFPIIGLLILVGLIVASIWSRRADRSLEGTETEWLDDVASYDKDNPQDGAVISRISVMWRLMDRTGAYFFDFQVHVHNGSVYDMALATRVEGHVAYDGATLLPVPEVNEFPADILPGNIIPHGKAAYVQLRQDITRLAPVVDKFREHDDEEVVLTFRELKIWAEYRTPSGAVVTSFPLKLPSRVQTPPVTFTDLSVPQTSSEEQPRVY